MGDSPVAVQDVDVQAAAVGISTADLAALSAAFEGQRANRVAAAAATSSGVLKAATDYRGVRAIPPEFSTQLEQGAVTSQEQSGRCWLFAGLNVLRYEVIQRWKLKDFEFSESYLTFYDKLEKSNYFLESVLSHLDEPVGSRLFDCLMRDVPANDGGLWPMFANLVRKYGLVPKGAGPESENSKKSNAYTQYLQTLLRKDAVALRTAHETGAALPELRALKARQLEAVYRLLAISLGEPVRQFSFVLRDKDDQVIEEQAISPRDFYDKYVGLDLDEFVSLGDVPTRHTPLGRRYRVPFSSNMADREGLLVANVGMAAIKKAVSASLQAGHPVWFGCDCDKFALAKEGLFDQASLRVEDLFDVGLGFADKGQMLEYHDSESNHAMTLMGVNIGPAGQPDRWRIENSWGKDYGKDGYFVASDQWFDNFVYEVIVQRQYLDADSLAVVDSQPVDIDPWQLCFMSD